MFYLRLEERDTFFTLNVGKKVSSFWGIDCESVTDCQAVNIISCTYRFYTMTDCF